MCPSFRNNLLSMDKECLVDIIIGDYYKTITDINKVVHEVDKGELAASHGMLLVRELLRYQEIHLGKIDSNFVYDPKHPPIL